MAIKDGITKRGNSWYVVMRETDSSTGQSKMVWHSGFQSETEAKAFRDERRVALRRRTAVRKDRITVSEYLDEWLPAHTLTKDLKPTTVVTYREKINSYIKPQIGETKLQLLTSSQIQQLYTQMLNAGLSRRSVEMTGTILRLALKHAVQQYRYIESSPAETVPIPRSRKKPLETWTPEQMRKILAVCEHSLYGALFITQAATGARRGELLALRWYNVDLDEATIRFDTNRVKAGNEMVEGTLKNDRHKIVPIDAITLASLKAHKKYQAECRLKSKKWLDEGYVFSNRNGGPLGPQNLARYWKQLIAKADVPYRKPHALRHTHATLLLEAGEPLHVVAERLGHKDAMVTATVYAHVTQQQSKKAADSYAEWLSQ
jgi:integrase